MMLKNLHASAKQKLVVAAAANNDEDKNYPKNPVTAVLATAIEKAAHR